MVICPVGSKMIFENFVQKKEFIWNNTSHETYKKIARCHNAEVALIHIE